MPPVTFDGISRIQTLVVKTLLVPVLIFILELGILLTFSLILVIDIVKILPPV